MIFRVIVRLIRLAFKLKTVMSWFTRPVQLGVRIILLQDGEIVLVRHTYMVGWHFPGGSINRGETPLEAAAREAKEEAGVELLEPPQMVGIFTSYSDGKSDHVVTYVCRNFRMGQATDRWEIAECRRVAIDRLPPDLGERWLKLVRDLTANQATNRGWT